MYIYITRIGTNQSLGRLSLVKMGHLVHQDNAPHGNTSSFPTLDLAQDHVEEIMWHPQFGDELHNIMTYTFKHM